MLFGKKMKVLVIQGRGLGDATITLGFIKALSPKYRIEILCSNHNQYVFNGFKTYSFLFPVNINFYLFLKNIPSYIFVISKLIFKKYDVIIDPVGGIQEHLLVSILRSTRKYSAFNYKNNPLNILFNRPFVGRDLSYYNFLESFFQSIFGKNVAKRGALPLNNNIGIAPFGGVSSRSLSLRRLCDLINLIPIGFNIFIYVDKNSVQKIDSNFLFKLRREVKVVSISVNKLFEEDLEVSYMIATDSFMAHFAFFKGAKLFFINSESNYLIWSPPNSIVLDFDKPLCLSKPCFGNRTCINQPYVNDCIENISFAPIENFFKNLK
jgi:ADP-heptose:LPS heptosyltransferase